MHDLLTGKNSTVDTTHDSQHDVAGHVGVYISSAALLVEDFVVVIGLSVHGLTIFDLHDAIGGHIAAEGHLLPRADLSVIQRSHADAHADPLGLLIVIVTIVTSRDRGGGVRQRGLHRSKSINQLVSS